MKPTDELKKAAAISAAALVKDGMIVGLGSGSTAAFLIAELGRRVEQGLRIVGVATSKQTESQARELGIPLASLTDEPEIDIDIDGADEAEESTLNLIKGRGGALLDEKIVAAASKRFVVIIDAGKLVARLEPSEPVPVEIVPFGWRQTARRLANLGATPVLRLTAQGQPFETDGGHHILDCAFPSATLGPELALQLDHVIGVVEHGLFIGMATELHVASAAGVRVIT